MLVDMSNTPSAHYIAAKSRSHRAADHGAGGGVAGGLSLVTPGRSGRTSQHDRPAHPKARPMTTTTRLPQMVAVDDLAMTLGVCTKTVRRWIKDGKLRAHHLGRRVLIAEEDAAAFIAAGRR